MRTYFEFIEKYLVLFSNNRYVNNKFEEILAIFFSQIYLKDKKKEKVMSDKILKTRTENQVHSKDY